MLSPFFEFFFWTSFKCICYRLFSMIMKFVTIFTAKILLIFLPMLIPIFVAKIQKSIAFYKYLISRLNWISCYFIYFTLSLITIMMFILSSPYKSLEFWSVNHISMYENSELNVFLKMKFLGEMYSNSPNDLLGTKVCNTLESCW